MRLFLCSDRNKWTLKGILQCAYTFSRRRDIHVFICFCLLLSVSGCFRFDARPLTDDLDQEMLIDQGSVADQEIRIDQEVLSDQEIGMNQDVGLPILDLCNGLDDDGDGEFDELDFPLPTALTVEFSQTTGVGNDGFIEITDGNGVPIEGSPFTYDDLKGATLLIEGYRFGIHLVIREGGDPTRGYEILRILNQDGEVLTQPNYPQIPLNENGVVSIPIDDTQVFEAVDSHGGGGFCGSNVGRCVPGIFRCVSGNMICADGVQASPEECNGEDDDCDGLVDEAEDLEAIRPNCNEQRGVCQGSRKVCSEDGQWICPIEEYGEDYQELEDRCDCLDNDCDGQIDQAGDRAVQCTFDDFVIYGRDRHCILRDNYTNIPSGEYHFGELTIEETKVLSIEPDGRCGHAGSGECMRGGGCLTVIADRINVKGKIKVEGESNPIAGRECGGASGGDLTLIADEVIIDKGKLQANGSDGSRQSAMAGGGAAGRIQIYAHHTRLINGGQIVSKGGNPAADRRMVYGMPGGGPGKLGGDGFLEFWTNEFPRGIGGGGGSGGPGQGGRGGDADSARPFELMGQLSLEANNSIQITDGDGNKDGVLIFGGQAIENGYPLFVNEVDYPPALYPLVIQLQDEFGNSVEGASIHMHRFPEGASWFPRTDQYGWVKSGEGWTGSDPYRFEIEAIQKGSLFLSYYYDGVSCTRTYSFEAGHLVIPPFSECGEAFTPNRIIDSLPCGPAVQNCPEIEWVIIPGASFMMGSVEGVGNRNEWPQHQVSLSDFEMMRTEITVAQYRACVESNVCSAPRCTVDTEEYGWEACNYAHGRENHPVNYINWHQIREFGQWVNADLPSEVQWEFAARSRGADVLYPWGNVEPDCTHADWDYLNNDISCHGLGTSEVCSLSNTSTQNGVCDLAGNLYEWTLDEYVENYIDAPSDETPRCSSMGCLGLTNRVARGGNWYTGIDDLHTRYRGNSPAEAVHSGLGGRLVRQRPSQLQP